MMQAKTTLKNLVLMAQGPDDFAAVIALANQELCRDNEEMMFVTVFLAQLALDTGELIYVNGGHNPPLVRQGGGICARRNIILPWDSAGLPGMRPTNWPCCRETCSSSIQTA